MDSLIYVSTLSITSTLPQFDIDSLSQDQVNHHMAFYNQLSRNRKVLVNNLKMFSSFDLTDKLFDTLCPAVVLLLHAGTVGLVEAGHAHHGQVDQDSGAIVRYWIHVIKFGFGNRGWIGA